MDVGNKDTLYASLAFILNWKPPAEGQEPLAVTSHLVSTENFAGIEQQTSGAFFILRRQAVTSSRNVPLCYNFMFSCTIQKCMLTER